MSHSCNTYAYPMPYTLWLCLTCATGGGGIDLVGFHNTVRGSEVFNVGGTGVCGAFFPDISPFEATCSGL